MSHDKRSGNNIFSGKFRIPISLSPAVRKLPDDERTAEIGQNGGKRVMDITPKMQLLWDLLACGVNFGSQNMLHFMHFCLIVMEGLKISQCCNYLQLYVCQQHAKHCLAMSRCRIYHRLLTKMLILIQAHLPGPSGI